MLHFIDQTSVGDHHMVFNASIIKILLIMYPADRIMLHGITSNHKSVLEFLSDKESERIVFRPIEYTKPLSNNIFFKAINYLRKERKRKAHFRELLNEVPNTDLVFLSITTYTCFYYFKKMKVKFEVPVIACLHGDLDFVFNANGRLEEHNATIYKKIFKINAVNFRYLLLNKIAKPILVKKGLLKSEEVLEIEHPYSDLGHQIIDKNISILPLKLAHIGSMEVKRKNSHYIYKLAQILFDEGIQKDKLLFQTIGLITPSVTLYKNNIVEEVVGNEKESKPKYLSRQNYEKALSDVNYTLFFYPEMEYVFRASGAIVDTISFEKPVITLNHPYFDYLFAKAGNVGYICDSLEDMKDLLKNIVSNPGFYEAEYIQQCTNLRNFKSQLSVEKIALDLKQQLSF